VNLKKYRPSSLDEFIGNQEVIRAVRYYMDLPSDEKAPTYIITGPYGTGKSCLARVICKELGTVRPGIDLFKINASSDRGIDTIREIIDQSYTPSLFTDVRTYVFEEANSITDKAAKALLDITENPPKGIHFIIVTYTPEKLEPALKSRGPNFQMGTLNEEESLQLLKKVVRAEGIKISKTIAALLIEYAAGIPRNLLTGLSLVRDCTNIAEARKLLAHYSESQDVEVIDLARALINGMAPHLFQSMVRDGYEAMKNNPEKYRVGIGGFLAKVALSPTNVSAMRELGAVLGLFSEPLSSGGHIKLVSSLIKAHGIMTGILEKG